MPKHGTKLTGREMLFADTVVNVVIDKLWQDGVLAGLQMTWNGRAVTLWSDGALGISGKDGDSHLYMK
jgi:hypothetical protein